MRTALLLLLSLPAADAASRPVLALSDVSVDRCGVVHGTVEVRSKRREREVTVLVDGVAHPVTVASRAEAVPFAVPSGRWRPTVEISAAWRFVDTAPVTVARPEWDVNLLVTPPRDTAEGEVPPLDVSVLGGCDTSALVLRVEGAAGVLHHGATGPVPLPLAMGSHPLDVSLLDGDHLVASEQIVVDVGPPCIDLDGDGHPQCYRRDCDDTDPDVHPGAEDVVGNGIDEDCDGRNGQDRDRDGFEDAAVGGDDCDDHQPLVNPAAIRFPDGDGDGASPFERVDFDCDGVVDVRTGPYDCDDANPAVPAPEAPVPTGIDEDCDGLVDEGTVVFDDDGDGLSEEQGDCDDADVRIHPGARETPDCRDEDCDGLVDDGVTRPEVDDRYEPNDQTPAKLPGAWYKKGLFGGRWKASRAQVRAVTRDLSDVERFTVRAHDGDFDSFYVRVSAGLVGADRSYEVTITSPHGSTARGTIDGTGESVGIGGKAGRNDSGDYAIEVRPVSGELDWCPLELIVSTG